MGRRAVVVGAGLAGLRTAEALRAHGYADGIVVVGDEPWRPYNRPPLSKEALAGELLQDLAHERLAYRVRKAATDVEWRLGSRVERADLRSRRVELADGAVLEYDALVAATGVTARRLVVPGPPPRGGGAARDPHP
jgi:3-phenylpropionate/trans-cinnamate dioxygenase ferredoxin reductase subunit